MHNLQYFVGGIEQGARKTTEFVRVQTVGKLSCCFNLIESPELLPMMAYTGRLRPKGVLFSGFYERVAVSLVEVKSHNSPTMIPC